MYEYAVVPPPIWVPVPGEWTSALCRNMLSFLFLFGFLSLFMVRIVMTIMIFILWELSSIRACIVTLVVGAVNDSIVILVLLLLCVFVYTHSSLHA